MEVEGPVLLLLTPQFFSREEGFFFVPSTSAKTEVEGSSYTEYPLPPKFWWWRVQVEVEGPVLLLLSPPVYKREEGGPSTSFGNTLEAEGPRVEGLLYFLSGEGGASPP